MNETENTFPDSSEMSELQEQCAELRRQSGNLRLALVVLSLTVTLFLGLSVHRASKDLDALRPQATQVVEINQKNQPAVQAFLVKLTEFGRTHKDFAPILAKYRISLTNASPLETPAIPAPTAPASSTTPLKK